LAKNLGHKICPVLPSLVQRRCDESFFKEIAGIRSEVKIHIFNKEKKILSEEGELQLTEYGISGIPVFQLSGAVNRYLYQNPKADLVAKIDFLPHMDNDTFQRFCEERMLYRNGCSVDEFFTGILNQKLMRLIIKLSDLKPEIKIQNADKQKVKKVFSLCRCFPVHIKESNGFDNAQVCTGGVDLDEVSDNLESLLVPNVYFAGEILDVDGKCGGYNLTWAFASGKVAGDNQ
jgi:predicted Rossmann fold flavoprotein